MLKNLSAIGEFALTLLGRGVLFVPAEEKPAVGGEGTMPFG
jgi:hypothetical protein